VTVADGQMHYRHVAGDEPPIVFLHQTALSSRCYEPLMRALQVANRLIAIDTPGFGASFHPEGWPSTGRYGRWILEALDALGVGAAHFFGHHTGASLATEIAQLAPARVLTTMLCGPVCLTSEERAAFRSLFYEPLRPTADGAHLLLNWRYTVDNNAGVAPEVIHDQVVDMLIAWRARPQAYAAVADHDFMAQFRDLRVPALILTARDDYFAAHTERCRALRPDAEIVWVGGANLAPELDSAGIATAMSRFLASPRPVPATRAAPASR
jgi:pimeloyl-ACP methyl ester carboxylesterase